MNVNPRFLLLPLVLGSLVGACAEEEPTENPDVAETIDSSTDDAMADVADVHGGTLGAFPEGTQFRQAGATCALPAVGMCANREDDCATHEDCGPTEACMLQDPGSCNCLPIGCQSDNDCSDGEACVCTSPNINSGPCGEFGRCANICTRSCRSDADCSDGTRCTAIFQPGIEGPGREVYVYACVGPDSVVPVDGVCAVGDRGLLVDRDESTAVCFVR